MEENSDTQEKDGVDVDNIPPEGHLCGVGEFLLQRRLLLRTQLGRFLLLKATEAHQRLLAQARLLFGF